MSNGQGPAISIFAEYEPRLFELYQRFRYNELICGRLTRRAMKLERLVRWSVLISLAISLLSGIFPVMNEVVLSRIWGTFTAAATLLTVYSLFEGSGEKQHRWFQVAMRFHASASEVEFFSAQVKRGKVTEEELAAAWKEFTRELDQLIQGAGSSFLEYEAEHREELSEDLATTLRRENKSR
jgi:hypothetical protein